MSYYNWKITSNKVQMKAAYSLRDVLVIQIEIMKCKRESIE